MDIVPVSPSRRSELLTSRFVTSWAALARPGDRGAEDPQEAAAAWASWLLTALVEVTTSRRSYIAVALDGRVYSSGSLGPRAHLEIPAAVWGRPDPLFPARLAAAGAGLRFPSLLFDEVVAIRRAVFAGPTSPALLERLERDRARLRAGLEQLTGRVASSLPSLDLVGDPGPVSSALAAPVTQDELAGLVPHAVSCQLRIEPGLVASSGAALARRLLVWTLSDSEGNVPAITPRLTRSSTVSDELFSPELESPAACLARLVLLGRIARHMGIDPTGVVPPEPPPPGFLRVVPARSGQQTPAAALSAAAAFVSQHPSASDAFALLQKLASGRYVLLVSEQQFSAAHLRLSAATGRAEEPDRADVDVVLPLLAGDAGEVVRATFARRRS